MKKFITSCPLQPKGALKSSLYNIDGNSEIAANNVETHFPIIPLIYTYTNEGDKIQVILIKSTSETTDYNKSLLLEELNQAGENLKIKIDLKQIDTDYNENITTQLKLFSDIIDYIKANDELYACLTYGTKPTPIVQMMVLNYAYRILSNIRIGCIVYGQRDHKNDVSTIFDISALFFMDEAVNNISRINMKNPTEAIKRILKMEE